MNYLLLEQGIYFIAQVENGRWKKLGVAPRPLPNFPLVPSTPLLENPPMSQALTNTPDAFTADLRREQAREAIAKLSGSDWGPLSPVVAWFPESIRDLVVVGALRYLSNNPHLLTVAQLTPKQVSAVKALADDAFGAVAAPLIGGWLRKLGPVLKATLKVYDPTTAEKGEATEEQLVNLLSRAMKKAVDSDDSE